MTVPSLSEHETSLLGIAGRRYMVIGAGGGMGGATAVMLAQAGADVAVFDVVPENASAVADEVRALGRSSVVVTGDVTDDAALRHAIDEAAAELGPFDGLVTIVGGARWGNLLDLSTDDWDVTYKINLRYVFVAAQHVARALVERGAPGSFVFISSVDGIRSAPFHAPYGAAKAGLINLVKSMAVEWTQHGIRANIIAPGAIVAPRIPLGSPEQELAIMGRVPAQRRGVAKDIAGAALYFLSDLSTYVTGQTLAVDGGLTAVGPIDYVLGSKAVTKTP